MGLGLPARNYFELQRAGSARFPRLELLNRQQARPLSPISPVCVYSRRGLPGPEMLRKSDSENRKLRGRKEPSIPSAGNRRHFQRTTTSNESKALARGRIDPRTEVWQLQAAPATPGRPTAVWFTHGERQYRYTFANLNLLSAIYRALVAFRYERIVEPRYAEHIVIEFTQVIPFWFVCGNLSQPLSIHRSQRAQALALVGQEGQKVTLRYVCGAQTPELADYLATMIAHAEAGLREEV